LKYCAKTKIKETLAAMRAAKVYILIQIHKAKLLLAYFMPDFPFGTSFFTANFSSSSWFCH